MEHKKAQYKPSYKSSEKSTKFFGDNCRPPAGGYESDNAPLYYLTKFGA